MKVCSICGDPKPLSEFGFTNKEKTRIDPRCHSCNIEYKKKLRHTKKKNNICYSCNGVLDRKPICSRCYEKRKRQRIELKQRAIKYLGYKCNRCGVDDREYFEIYDFHHTDTDKKVFELSKALSSNTGNVEKIWKKIQPELDKCILLCSNCHRIWHFREKDKEIEWNKLK